MEYAVEGSAANQKFIRALMPSMLKQLGLEKYNHAILIKMSTACNGGLTIPIKTLDSFLILIRPGSIHHIALTLSHELVHVKQVVKGQLKTVKGGHIWMNKFYKNNVKYLDQPWEQDAYARQELIMRRAIE